MDWDVWVWAVPCGVFFLFFQSVSPEAVLANLVCLQSMLLASYHPLLHQGPLLPTAQPCLPRNGCARCMPAPLSAGPAGRGAAEPLQSAVLPAAERAQLPLRAGTLGRDLGSRCLRYKTSLRFPNGAFSWQRVESMSSFDFGG